MAIIVLYCLCNFLLLLSYVKNTNKKSCKITTLIHAILICYTKSFFYKCDLLLDYSVALCAQLRWNKIEGCASGSFKNKRNFYVNCQIHYGIIKPTRGWYDMRRSIYNEPKNCFFLLFHMNYGVLCRRTFFVPKKESRSRKLNEDEQVIGLLEFCNLFTFYIYQPVQFL